MATIPQVQAAARAHSTGYMQPQWHQAVPTNCTQPPTTISVACTTSRAPGMVHHLEPIRWSRSRHGASVIQSPPAAPEARYVAPTAPKCSHYMYQLKSEAYSHRAPLSVLAVTPIPTLTMVTRCFTGVKNDSSHLAPDSFPCTAIGLGLDPSTVPNCWTTAVLAASMYRPGIPWLPRSSRCNIAGQPCQSCSHPRPPQRLLMLRT